jgi:hypothetical protein
MATKYAKEIQSGDKFAADCDVFTAVAKATVNERGMAVIEVRHTRHNRKVAFPPTKLVSVLNG